MIPAKCAPYSTVQATKQKMYFILQKNLEVDWKKYKVARGKLDTSFQLRKNVIFKQVHFNWQNQLEGEMAEQYITVLYSLAENCKYGVLQGEMIRDCLVVGIYDSALSECLELTQL